MLRGTFQSKYFKNGNEMFVYALVGPTVEMEEYCAISEARLGRPAGSWTKNEAGQPLHHVNVTFLKRNGQMPSAVIDLIKSYDGSQYRIDTTKADMAKYQRYEAAKEVAMGEYLAKLELGLIEAPRPGARIATAATPQAGAKPAGAEKKDITNDILNGVGGNGTGDLGDGAEEPAAVGAGEGEA